MKDVFDAIIFYEDLTEAQQSQLEDALSKDPELARSFKRWRKLQREVRTSVKNHVPNRESLVLYALSKSSPAFLSTADQQHVAGASEALEAAIEAHPALNDVVQDIQNASADFLSLWDDLATSNNESHSASGTLNADRPATPPSRKDSKEKGLGWTSRPLSQRISAIFVMLALVATASILLWRSQNLEIIKTSPGEFRVIELTDGSTVRLLGRSKISYSSHDDRFSNKRSIQLRGRAFFDVAPSSSPFIVRTATALTEATGTRFSIEADLSQTKVILTSGQVAVSSRLRRGENVLLAPGEMSLVPRIAEPSQPAAMTDLTDMLSWTGLLVFHDTPLSEVAAHLSDHYNVAVTIDPALLEEQWVATYDPDTLSVNEILDNLATTLGAVVESTGENAFRLHR